MKCAHCSGRDKQILHRLSAIPQKLLNVHGIDNATEFVLHELCGSDCFNLSRAAFFVDNPDFNCCKGIAGCCCNERYHHHDDVWAKPDHFSGHMQDAIFNTKVRKVHGPSITEGIQDVVGELARQLEIKNPAYHTWQLKNNNKGLLIFEADLQNYQEIKDLLPNGLSLLGFCPIF